MEPITFTLGLAPVFSACLKCFRYLKAVQSFPVDVELLVLKLDIEHERMRAWGEANGILKTAGKRRNPGLDLPSTDDLIMRTLRSILSLFRNSEKLREHYGLQPVGGNYLETTNPELLGTSGLRNTRKSSVRISFLLKAKWAIHDKDKFTVLISEIKGLVDQLYQILPAPNKVRENTVLKAIKFLLNGNKFRLLAGRPERLGVKDESQNQDLVWLSDR